MTIKGTSLNDDLMDPAYFDLNNEQTVRYVTIILIVIVYYLIAFYFAANYGSAYFVILLALPYPILLLFIRGYNDDQLSKLVKLLFLAYLFGAFLFLIYAAIYNISGSRGLSFVLTLVVWLLMSIVLVKAFKRSGIV